MEQDNRDKHSKIFNIASKRMPLTWVTVESAKHQIAAVFGVELVDRESRKSSYDFQSHA